MDELRPRFNRLALIAILVLAVVVVYFLLEAGGRLELGRIGKDKPPYFIEGVAVPSAKAASTTEEITCSRNNAIVRATQKVAPSVVSISTLQVEIVRDPWFDRFFPFGPGIKRENHGLGSGFIIDKRGYVLTNQHVVEDADEITVNLSSGEELKARIMGADYESDLAVLKIDAGSDLPVPELGDSSDLMVGEWAIAIGNPFGFLIKDSAPSVSLGVISATGRSIQESGRVFNDLIQTDATINPGNSGGPLVNCFGQVIGMNTAIFSTSGGSQGVGFAIPINTAKRVINDLVEHGIVMEPWVGIEYQEMSRDIAKHLNSPVDEGLLISDIIERSPAHEAGLMRGDIIVKIGDEPVRTLDEATAAIRSLRSGQEAIFQIVRNGELQDVSVKVGTIEAANIAKAWFGLLVQEPTPEAAKKYGLSSYKSGILVIQVDRDSPADKAKLERGDLILSMSKELPGLFRNFSGEEVKINEIDDFRKFVSGVRRGQRIKIIFERRAELWRTYLTAERS